MNVFSSLLTRLKQPTVMIYILSIILFSIVLFLTYKLRPFNSDDVFWQVITANGWTPFKGSVALGNTSIHIDKLPLYWLTDLVGLAGRKALFVQSLFVGLASVTAFYWSSVYLLRKLLAKTTLSFSTLLPFLWLMGLGYALYAIYLDPNWRSFQISFAFVLFALTYSLWHSANRLKSVTSRVTLVLVTIYSGLLIYGDPYLLYFALAPLAVFTVVSYYPLRKINLRTGITTLISIIAAFVFSKIFAAVGVASGVHISVGSKVELVTFDGLANNIGGTIHSVLTLFGADFFGLTVGRGIVLPLLNFVALAIIATAIYLVAKKGLLKQRLDSSWVVFLVALLVGTVIFYILTTMNQGVSTYRYLLFTALLAVFLFAYFMSTLKNKMITYTISIILILSIVLGVAHLTRTPVVNQANSDNYHVIDLLKEKGYNKGYAGYWDANINSYLSHDDVRVLPTLCSIDAIFRWHWLIDNNAFSKPAEKSFYIMRPTSQGLGANCTPEILSKQLGEPSEKVTYNDQTIYLYNYDITDRL